MKKKLIFVSVIIAILLIGIAVAGVISKSRVRATETEMCTCGDGEPGDVLETIQKSDGIHHDKVYNCLNCSKKIYIEEECDFTDFINNPYGHGYQCYCGNEIQGVHEWGDFGDTCLETQCGWICTHPDGYEDKDDEINKAATCTEEGAQRRKCKICNLEGTDTIEALDHNWENKDGICAREGCGETCDHTNENDDSECDVCGYTMNSTDDGEDSTCNHNGEVGYINPATGHHQKICDLCKEPIEEAEECTKNPDTLDAGDGEGYHQYNCIYCKVIVPEDCSDVENIDGKCDVCGKTMSSGTTDCNHPTTEWDSDANKHWKKCKDTNCGKKLEETEENHYISGGQGTDNNNGTHTGNCKVCSEPYTEEHSDEDSNNYCDICGATLNSGTTHTHTGGTHANGGKCTVEGCGETYQTHEKDTTKVVSYTNKTATEHTPVYGCTFTDCTGTYEGTAEAHTGGTHENGGKCEVEGCGVVYQNHTKSTTVKEYKKTTTEHTPVYGCTYSGCTGTFNGEGQNHYISGGEGTDNSDGTHTGNCKVCLEPYTEVHRDEDNNNECDICEATLNSGTTHTHTGGTHANGGKCTVEGCGETYQNHTKSTTAKDYINETSAGHTPVYGCTYSGCTGTYEGVEEAHKDEDSNNKCDLCDYAISSGTTHTHTGGTHANGGKCTVEGCGETYQNHTKSTTAKDYINETSAGHTPVYGCTYSGCTGTYEGAEEAHKDEDSNNKCDTCGYTMSSGSVTQECKHTNTAWGRTETEHWKVCIDCGKEVTGTREKHSYTNGKCECGRLEDSTTCEHKNKEWKSDEDEHWQVCKDCGEEISGTRESHTYEDDKCKDCGKDKDSTTSGKDIPGTGSKTVAIGIVSIIAIMGMSVIGIKKYKGI